MSEDARVCQSCTFRNSSLARNEVFIIAIREGKHDVSNPDFYRIFGECSFPSTVDQHFATDVAESARDRVIARDADLARRAAGGPYGRPDCYHVQADSTSSEQRRGPQRLEAFACEANLLKTFQRSQDNNFSNLEDPAMWRFKTWMESTERWNLEVVACQRRQMMRSRDQVRRDFESEQRKHSSFHSSSFRKTKAKYDGDVKKSEAIDDNLDLVLGGMLEWQWLMCEIWRLLLEDCHRGTASFSVASFVGRCSPFEKKRLYTWLELFGDIIDWEATEAAIRSENNDQEAAPSTDPVHVRETTRKYREYPPLPEPCSDDLDSISDPRPHRGSDYDEVAIFGKVWAWWHWKFEMDIDLIHYRTDGTYEERAREFWRRYRTQKLEEGKARAQKARKHWNVPGMTNDGASDDSSEIASDKDDEADPEVIAERMQRIHVTDTHLTGTSSATRHKRTHGKKKRGNGKKKGKKGKKQGKK